MEVLETGRILDLGLFRLYYEAQGYLDFVNLGNQ